MLGPFRRRGGARQLVLGVLDRNVENEGTPIFFASRRHGRALPWATAMGRGYCPSKERPQLLQPLSSSVFFERGRTRRPRTPPLAYALQQCLELCWSLCNLTASHRWLHAGSVHNLASIASSWAASSSAAGHEAVLYAFVSRVLCGAAVSCVCIKCFLKPVTHHASPHSSWT